MNKEFYRKINKAAAKYRWNIEVMQSGVRLSFLDRTEYDLARGRLNRMQNIVTVTNYNTWSIRVYNDDDYRQMQDSEDKTGRLVNRFFEVLRETLDQTQAKAAEWELAQEIGAENEFNKIYA